MGRGFIWIAAIVLLGIGLIYVQYSKRQVTTQIDSIFSGDRAEVARVSIDRAEEKLELIKKAGTWHISGHDTLQIRQDRIDGLFDNVLSVKRSTVMTEDLNKWPTYSVNDASGLQLTLFDGNGNTVGAFVFGPSRSDWSKSYVRIEPSPTVYLADQNVVYRLSTSETFWGEVSGPIGVEADSPRVIEVDVPGSGGD